MKLSYAITVCNESKDLYSLVSFLIKVIDDNDEINVLVDTKHVTKNVRAVIDHFKNHLVVHEREFDGDFASHRNFHITKCSGDYIFIIDPDEMPKEKLIKNVKNILEDTKADLLVVPRINISHGFTEEWIKSRNFTLNELDWINWPDYICRVFKKDENIKYGNKLHENIIGFKKHIALNPDPSIAIWHIKTVDKQDNRWDENGNFTVASEKGDNLYDNLM